MQWTKSKWDDCLPNNAHIYFCRGQIIWPTAIAEWLHSMAGPDGWISFDKFNSTNRTPLSLIILSYYHCVCTVYYSCVLIKWNKAPVSVEYSINSTKINHNKNTFWCCIWNTVILRYFANAHNNWIGPLRFGVLVLP